ncbi:MAG: hypothetical protein AAFX06_19170 [Planctomycetota bacterium]
MNRIVCLLSLFLAVVVARPSRAEDAAARGYRFLTESPVLTSDFHQDTVDALWHIWPAELRERAEKATPEERRKMTFDRYGLTIRPGDESAKPLQYVVGEKGNWTMNCFACHGGSVYGTPTPGAPNNRYALSSLTEEITLAKAKLGQLPGTMEMGSLFIPLGTTNGTTNAVVFGMALMRGRDAELNVVPTTPRFFTNHDMDAPPWWHFYKRPYIYIDGFAQKGHRGLMQFSLIPENGPDFFRRHEKDFEDVFAYISSLRAPKYKGEIDADLADQGRSVFERSCAECHGTYGSDWTYPNRMVPLEEIGTDPVRLSALTVKGRKRYAESWFAHAGESDEQETLTDPEGYVAPPLDGVWASAPYFHNGSVPTLWHVLNPSERPTIWRRTSEAMDEQRVGLTVEEVDRVPADGGDSVFRRSFFDTRKFGKSRSGHDYPDELTDTEKTALLEYLKTL